MIEEVCPNGCPDRPWGIQLQGVYDGICYWTCPSCGVNWHRWPERTDGQANRIREACERAWAARGDGER